MQSLVSGGLAAAQAARLVLSGEPEPRTDSGSAAPWRMRPATSARHWTGWMSRLPTAPLTGSSRRTPSRRSCRRSYFRTCTGSGNGWEAGEVSVAQEHFASNLLRGRLLGLAQGWGQGQGPLAILACVPGEHHELGLLVFGVALRRRGWRITYLGTDSPIGAVADIARSLAPAVVVLLSINPDNFLDHARQIKQLAKQVPVVIAGTGATPEVARHTQTRCWIKTR